MFFPKKSKALDYVSEQTGVVVKTAQVFDELARDFKLLKDNALALERLEKNGDEFVHLISREVEETFILPMDKEDIQRLTQLLDTIIDKIEEAANRLVIYHIKETTPAIEEFSKRIVESIKQIETAVKLIHERKYLSAELAESCKKLHELEEDGDKIHREALRALMGETPKNQVLSIIKLKDIYLLLEDTLDTCEDAAILFETFKIKYG